MAVLRAKHESNQWNDVEKFIYGKSKVAWLLIYGARLFYAPFLSNISLIFSKFML